MRMRMRIEIGKASGPSAFRLHCVSLFVEKKISTARTSVLVPLSPCCLCRAVWGRKCP